MKNISDFYVKNLITSPDYFSKNPVKKPELLLPEFLTKVNNAIAVFKKTHSYDVLFVETYRSNSLQLIHFNNGASKIRENGMHHYGIAVDCAFLINGKFSYDGDYKLLRELFIKQGLFLLGEWDKGHVQFISVASQPELRAAVKSAVKSFQKQNGLTADGIVGPKTISKAKLFQSKEQ